MKRRREDLHLDVFTQQGKAVAVYYDHQFYVGNVLEVKEGGKVASVTFMKQVQNRNVFVWPEVEDISDVNACFVFKHDLDLTSLTNGRTWSVSDLEELDTLYQRYKDMH